jgi:acyl-CoA synthetase (AMP-forming)/AMP-acid ligase II
VLRFVEDIPLGPGHPSHELVDAVQRGLERFRDRPMLICWGDHDFVFDKHFLAEWQRRFPDAEVHRFADAGHYVLEDAGERILPLIREFLDRPEVGSQACAMPNPTNIAAAVPTQARLQPDTAALIEPRGKSKARRWSFAELDHESDVLARGLQHLGITRGTRTVLMVPPSLEFYGLTFALFKLGAVVVLIDPGMGIGNLGVCLAEAEPEAFIGVTKAHLARVLLGWGKPTLRAWVTVGPRLGWSGVSLRHLRRLGQSGPAVMAPTQADDLAAILFTSGSTGVAKGVQYSHGIFTAQVRLLQQVYGIEPGEIDLPTFPLFGLFAPALGMTAVIPEMDATRPGNVDPERILNAISQYGVTNLFGSPALIRRVGRYGQKLERKLPSLRRVISAGAPVPADALRRFASMLSPGIEVHTPYGATEALPVASIGSTEILTETSALTANGAGVCVGRPVPGVQVRIITIRDDVIAQWSDDLLVPDGTIGEIIVQGPVVTPSYHNRPESTQLAKIADPAGSCWHRMGDVGYLDAQGRLWFCGRKTQRVITPAGTLFTISCEGVFNAHPAVFRTALVGVTRHGATEAVLCVELDPEAGRKGDEAMRSELLDLGAQHAHTKAIRTVLFHPAFPVDIRHNAKIFREKLAVWARHQLS